MRVTSLRERRLVALLILVAVIAGFLLLVVGPIAGGFAERAERREALLRQYQLNQRLGGSVGRLSRQAARQREALRGLALMANSPAQAAAELDARLQAGIEAAGGELRSSEQISATEDGLARARATARIGLPQLVAVLARLQNQPPYATVERLSIAADQAVVSGQLEPLDVSLEVSIPSLRAAAR